MVRRNRVRSGLSLAGISLVSGVASGQVLSLSADAPTLDRWMYPFNGTPGTRAIASIFFSGGEPMFDDRDAQFIVGFDTDGAIPEGLDTGEYRVISATLRAWIDNDAQFRYDPTPDPTSSFYDPADPEFTADADVGRPIEVFGVAYRGGFDLSSWSEGTTYSADPLSEETRTAYAAQFDELGAPTDVSNQVRDRFDPAPLGIGMMPTLSPGDEVPAGTEVVFELDLCAPGLQAYFGQSLSGGRVNLAITSLHPASGGPGGQQGDTTFPIFRTRENILSILNDQAPKLELTVRVGSPGNYDGIGGVDFSDVIAFLSDFGAGDPAADLAPPCGLDFSDVIAFLTAFAEG